MNQTSTPRGRSLKPLLLIPAAIMVAKGMSRHRARWESADGEPGVRRHGPGRHGRFGPVDPVTGEFRVPPKIEAMLDAWHRRAHEAGEPHSETV